jgi:hypothetical protein
MSKRLNAATHAARVAIFFFYKGMRCLRKRLRHYSEKEREKGGGNEGASASMHLGGCVVNMHDSIRLIKRLTQGSLKA